MGALAHKYNSIFITDTTSTYGLLPIDIEKDNIDFCMASSQKGMNAFTGVSYLIGKKIRNRKISKLSEKIILYKPLETV